MLLKITRASLWNRRFAVALTLFTVAISVALLLPVVRLRVETRRSFARTIYRTDLIVGARTGPVQLLLSSVFRIGDASNNSRYRSFQELAALPQVAWAIPISRGDSHRGYRVLGTTSTYFEHFRYADQRGLKLARGAEFAGVGEAVLGAEVAARLGYEIGDAVVIAHGIGNRDIMVHDDQPFRVVGILERTGTPVDRTLHVSLQSIDAIHADWQHGVRIPRRPTAGDGDASREVGHDVHVAPATAAAAPQTITAVFLGLKNRAAAFALQRQINEYSGEPLLAIMPAMTMAQLWSLVGVAESALLLVAWCVVVAGLLGMTTALVSTLSERRREMAILRAIGARPWQIAALLMLESALITLLGTALGVLLVQLGVLLLAPSLSGQFGLHLQPLTFTLRELGLVLAVLVGGQIAGILPALLAWRRSLADGLTIRI